MYHRLRGITTGPERWRATVVNHYMLQPIWPTKARTEQFKLHLQQTLHGRKSNFNVHELHRVGKEEVVADSIFFRQPLWTQANALA